MQVNGEIDQLSRSRFFSHEGLASLVTSCGNLVEIDLSKSTDHMDAAAAALAEAKNLERLCLARCKLITNIGIGCFVVGCRKPSFLGLKLCVGIGDLGVGLIAVKCKDIPEFGSISLTCGMDSHKAYSFTILFAISLLSLNYKAIYGDSTVAFLDSPTHQYLRDPSSQTGSLSPSEIGATVSVLLGFAPPSTLTASSSSKLNEVLMPNPFDRPRALLMLEVTGAEEFKLVSESEESPFSHALRVKVEGSERVDIQLTGEDEVSLVSLNEVSSNTDCSDKDLSEFASWLGGSYVKDESQQLSGELIIPTTNGNFLRLHLSERADREFATSLVSLVNSISQAKEMHQVLTKSVIIPAELITGRFDGLKALQDHYGKESIAQSGLEVFVISISKAFNLLQSAYQGQIVGVIAHSDQLGFQVTVPQPSARQLEETEISPELMKLAEVMFVRRALAWITGIILLIATILGIHFLMNMPITKDTLLYSNVKLD